jgi:hypothetical protein
MSSHERKEEDKAQPPTPPRWKGADSLELVYRLNGRAFMLLKQSAGLHGRLWVQLDMEALRRAARFPFLIVDVHFLDEAWWRQVLVNPQGSTGEGSPVCLSTPESAQKLMSEVLVFAWHMAKSDRRVAQLVLGMAPSVVEIFRGLAPQELDAVSGLRCGALRLRWQEDQEFWTRLVRAARDGDEEALADIHLHAKLLLSGELMTRSTGKVGT